MFNGARGRGTDLDSSWPVIRWPAKCEAAAGTREDDTARPRRFLTFAISKF